MESVEALVLTRSYANAIGIRRRLREQARQLQEAMEATKLDLFQKNWSRAASNCDRARSAGHV